MPLGETFENNFGEPRYPCTECGNEYSAPMYAEECCSPICAECGSLHDSHEQAEECCSYYCLACEAAYSNERDANRCCEHIWICSNCGGHWDNGEQAENCCGHHAVNAQGDRFTSPRQYPAEILTIEPSYVISIPPLPDRPVRTCSVEQELSSGGRAVAGMLHELGYSELGRVANYSRDAQPGAIVVKEDGSLPPGGAEVVYSRFNLSHPQGIGRLSKAMACIRALKEAGQVTTTRAAGLHIHIGATTVNEEKMFGPAQLAALYEIFSFSESVLFKLASAGWDSHRGDSYSTRLQKYEKHQLTAGRIAIGNRRHRYFALNFQRLLSAAQQCGCGACAVGDWENCECGVLQGGTIEWRVFNATTKPETLHAWLVLAHSMTAAAFNHQLGTLDPNGFEEADPHPERDPWILGWILNNCPLLDPEKQVVIDLAKRAPGLQVDWEDFEKNVVSWGGQGQTELVIPGPPESEDDGEVAPPRNPPPPPPRVYPRPPQPASLSGAEARAAMERVTTAMDTTSARILFNTQITQPEWNISWENNEVEEVVEESGFEPDPF